MVSGAISLLLLALQTVLNFLGVALDGAGDDGGVGDGFGFGFTNAGTIAGSAGDDSRNSSRDMLQLSLENKKIAGYQRLKCAGAPLGTLLLVRMVECGGCGKLKRSAVFVEDGSSKILSVRY